MNRMLNGEDYGQRVIPTAHRESDNIVLNFDDLVDHLIALFDMYKQGFLGRDETPADIISDYRLILGDDIVSEASKIAKDKWYQKEGVGKVKDSVEEPDYNWLKHEVYHWLFEQDVTEGEYDNMSADEVAELIETRIENYNDPADYGFDAGFPEGNFHRNVKYLVTEINNRGWDYMNKNY